MKRLNISVVAAALTTVLAGCSSDKHPAPAGHEASEKGEEADGEMEINASAVPQQVRDAVTRAYPGATASEWSRETDEGQEFFEAGLKLTEKGVTRSLDVRLSHDGRIVEEEETIPASALPDAVRQALKASEYGSHTVRRAERVVLDGKRDAPLYELHLSQNDHTVEVVMDAHGKFVKSHGDEEGEDEEGEEHEKG